MDGFPITNWVLSENEWPNAKNIVKTDTVLK